MTLMQYIETEKRIRAAISELQRAESLSPGRYSDAIERMQSASHKLQLSFHDYIEARAHAGVLTADERQWIKSRPT